MSFKDIVVKGKYVGNQDFLLFSSHNVFYTMSFHGQNFIFLVSYIFVSKYIRMRLFRNILVWKGFEGFNDQREVIGF